MAHVNKKIMANLKKRSTDKVFDLRAGSELVDEARKDIIKRILAMPVCQEGKYNNSLWYRKFITQLEKIRPRSSIYGFGETLKAK